MALQSLNNEPEALLLSLTEKRDWEPGRGWGGGIEWSLLNGIKNIQRLFLN